MTEPLPMSHRAKRLSQTTWSLWVDSRGRITIPKALFEVADWRHGDTLVWIPLEDGGLELRSLDRDMRSLLAELETLRGTKPATLQAERLNALAGEIAGLAEYRYPVDQSSSATAFAQQAFAGTQALAKLRATGATDLVDVILTALEARKAAHKVVTDLKKKPSRRSRRS